VEDRNGDVGRRWPFVRMYHPPFIAAGALVAIGGIGVLTVGTFILASALGQERPSLQPLVTTGLVLIVGLAVLWLYRRLSVGNAYAELGPDSLVVRAGFMVDVRVAYEDITDVNPPPVPLVHWEGYVGFHLASKAVRVGAGRDCVEVVLRTPHTGGGLRLPGMRFTRLWLAVRDPLSFVDALASKIAQHP